MHDALLAAAPPRTRESDAAWRQLHQAACAPYRAVGQFAWHFARGKLGRDPVFRAMLERGYLVHASQPDQPMRVLDIGCGQGLMASLLQACAEPLRQRRWPASWPLPPRAVAYTGVELMPRDVQRAQHALRDLPIAPRFLLADMRNAVLPPCELVVILDVLHYVDHADQHSVLSRVRDALTPRGRLLLRVGDASRRRAYRTSQWVDLAVTLVRGHRVAPVWGRTLAEWVSLLQQLGFAAKAVPMSQGLPFANVLLVAELGSAPRP